MRRFRSMPEEFRGNDLMENLFRTAEVESLSANEKKQYLSYMTTERDLINQRAFAIEKATNAGFAKGLAEGEARGEARGKQQSRIEIARELKSRGLSLDLISQCTGLTVDEIAKS